jgi:hypothetical protein
MQTEERDQPRSGSSICSEDESHSFRSPQKVSRSILRQVSWLGGRHERLPHRFAFPGLSTEWLSSETATLTHSGGTAPVSHRTSLLGPCGHLRLTSMQEQTGRLQEHAKLQTKDVHFDNDLSLCYTRLAFDRAMARDCRHVFRCGFAIFRRVLAHCASA